MKLEKIVIPPKPVEPEYHLVMSEEDAKILLLMMCRNVDIPETFFSQSSWSKKEFESRGICSPSHLGSFMGKVHQALWKGLYESD